jgi:hypothetical protein
MLIQLFTDRITLVCHNKKVYLLTNNEAEHQISNKHTKRINLKPFAHEKRISILNKEPGAMKKHSNDVDESMSERPGVLTYTKADKISDRKFQHINAVDTYAGQVQIPITNSEAGMTEKQSESTETHVGAAKISVSAADSELHQQLPISKLNVMHVRCRS